jgi:hypothetical protein
MADEDPSATNPGGSNAPKKETVRITLPPKPEETPMVKRETVRINAPGAAPKKETTNIGAAKPLGAGAPVPPPPPAATRPLVPPPAPRPPSAPPSVPPMGGRPGAPGGPKPTVPLTPSPAPKPAPQETTPITMKAAPKKETARIQVAPTQKLASQPTVRLSQPTQSLAAAPASAVRTAPPSVAADEAPATDGLANALSWVAVLVSAIAAGLSFWVWNSMH